MSLLGESLALFAQGDAETWRILTLTLRVGASGLMLGLALGVPAGLGLALGRFPGRRLLLFPH